MTNSTVLALSVAERWQGFWAGNIGEWILTRGLRIALLMIGALLAARFISWAARRIVRRIDAGYEESDQLVRSESAKHRQAVASVISWVSIAILFVIVMVEITDILAIPVGSLVAPAAVLGAALGFGAQRMVQDMLSGFFIITEKQYGFGDLVQLSMAAVTDDALGTVEDVTLRVTKLRSTEGEMITIPNGLIVKSLNLSKDWARSVVDIPVPASANLNQVNEVLHGVCQTAMEEDNLRELLLDAPQLMGVESIELDTVNLRMMARTLPGKQFEVGRRLRVLVVAALDAGRHRHARRFAADGRGHRSSGDHRGCRGDAGPRGEAVKFGPSSNDDGGRRPGHILGRMRTSTAALIVAFIALFWVYQTVQPEPVGSDAPTQVVPPGFVPDPNYTWVPRTNVRRPKETVTTTTPTTTTPTETTTPSPTETTSPTSPTEHADTVRASRDGAGANDTNDDDARRRTRTGAHDDCSAEIARPAQRSCTATLACRDDHPRPCQQAVQVLGAARAGRCLGQDRQG